MKILYVTDLHGRRDAYEIALDRALKSRVEAIVNGGDLYPLGSDLFAVQREFLKNYLPEYLERCRKSGLAFLATLGNMDLKGHDALFQRVMGEHPHAHSLLESGTTLDGYTFIGSAMTTDGPFSLKDRCLRDTRETNAHPARGPALVSDSRGIHPVADWPRRADGLPSLEEHLAALPAAGEPDKTVYVLHQPPYGVGQGIIASGTDVGSRAVANFLAAHPARLSLHGHIHESPFAGGRWRSRIGGTACVQPGQLSGAECVSVVIDLETLEMERTC